MARTERAGRHPDAMGRTGTLARMRVDPTGAPDLLDYLRILWRNRLVVIVAVVLAVAATVAVDSVRARTYEGTANLLFISQSYDTATGSVNPLTPTDIATDIQLVKSSQVRTLATKALGSQAPPVQVAEIGTTEVAAVSVTSSSPVRAARAANAYANAYVKLTTQRFAAQSKSAEDGIQLQMVGVQSQINSVLAEIDKTPATASPTLNRLNSDLTGLDSHQQQLQTELGQLQDEFGQSPSGGQVVAPAVPSHSPVSPKKTTDAILGGVIGLILGIVLALVRDFADDRIRTQSELEVASGGLPSLGLIPRVHEWRDGERPMLVAVEQPKSAPAEAYRGLRTAIQFLGFDRPIKKVQITSPTAGDGKTTTATNLAVAMALAGQSVVLVSCDLRRPRLHNFFGLSNSVGFTSVLVGEVPLQEALIRVPGIDQLLVLPSGPVPPNPSELLGSEKARAVIDQLAHDADIVIIDSPPVLPVTDSSVLATVSDAVIMVVMANRGTRRELRRSLETLARVNSPVAGTILNGASDRDAYVYYRYDYTYDPPTDQGGAGPRPRANGHGPSDQPTGEPTGARPRRGGTGG